MAAPLPFFGEPAPKKRRPDVPRFVAPADREAAEYERRLKAGLPVDPPGVPRAAAAPPASAGLVPAPAAPGGGPSAPSPAPPQHTFSAPSPSASSSKGKAGTVPAPTPRASDHTGSDTGGSLECLEEVDDLGAAGPKVGKKFANVYGFQSGTRQATQAARKAIHLHLEPLREGLPAFERVLSEERQSVTVGSKRGAVDLVIIDEAVSKKHCVLALIGIHGELALSVVDHSTNGTFVNGKRVPTKGKRYRIRSGDRLEVKDAALEADFGWKCDFGNTVAFFTRGN